MKLMIVAALIAAAPGASAAAQALADLPMKPPVYRRVPGSASPIPGAAAYMPLRAAAERIHGEVVLACVLSAKGKLDPCRVVSETPAGYGFAQAVLEMAGEGHVRAKPTIVEGTPREGELVRVKINFDGQPPRM
jgi:protein TonB